MIASPFSMPDSFAIELTRPVMSTNSHRLFVLIWKSLVKTFIEALLILSQEVSSILL
jgi:hypothetical protein